MLAIFEPFHEEPRLVRANVTPGHIDRLANNVDDNGRHEHSCRRQARVHWYERHCVRLIMLGSAGQPRGGRAERDPRRRIVPSSFFSGRGVSCLQGALDASRAEPTSSCRRRLDIARQARRGTSPSSSPWAAGPRGPGHSRWPVCLARAMSFSVCNWGLDHGAAGWRLTTTTSGKSARQHAHCGASGRISWRHFTRAPLWTPSRALTTERT